MNRIINWLVLFLFAVGVVFLTESVISLTPYQVFTKISTIVKYLSLPSAIAVKAVQLLMKEFRKLEDIKTIALNNRSNDESIREQIRFIRDDVTGSRIELSNSLLELEKRLIRLEARSELSTKLERHERLLIEQNERINKLSKDD